MDAAVAEYMAQGFHLKAVSDTTASLEKIGSGYKPVTAFLLLMLCMTFRHHLPVPKPFDQEGRGGHPHPGGSRRGIEDRSQSTGG